MEHRVCREGLEHELANDEVDLYRDSDERNGASARGIEKAIVAKIILHTTNCPPLFLCELRR